MNGLCCQGGFSQAFRFAGGRGHRTHEVVGQEKVRAIGWRWILPTIEHKICIHSDNELKFFGNRPTEIIGGL